MERVMRMNMLDWAKKEIEIACERERAAGGDMSGYGCACYESALRAFSSLLGDGHSGFSIGVTKSILNRLIDGHPLSPIEDTDDIWHEIRGGLGSDDFHEYQCTRMSSLFKKVYADGRITYNDVNRTRVTYAANPDIFWSNGQASAIIDEMLPITMPYVPRDKPYVIRAEDFLTDPKNGDYDTVGYLYAITPDGERIEINRYFKDSEDPTSRGMEEIDHFEYMRRWDIAIRSDKNET